MLAHQEGLSGVDRSSLRARLVELVEPVVQDHGALLVDLELMGVGSNQTVRVLVHREPGVTLDMCEAVSREVADLLDVEDPISGRYRLEVTSPGLDRPLRTDLDFARADSRRIKVVLSSGRNVYGRLVDWEADRLTLDTDQGTRFVGRQDIAKATIEAEL